ncbi:MAG: hypothetical protein QME05_04755 [Candidatus Margulisbacteria bacterium]|nr:hypothetical protein [Candidatus Margulisiibacteriota bacterium]
MQKIIENVGKSQRVASAYAFMGPPDSEKKGAAQYFAEVLGCKKQDYIFIQPDGASIKIEQVREVQEWVKYGPSASSHLLVVIDEADKLTDQAAAAFLKTLEEPPPGVVFVLLIERQDRLPATIYSRCQRLVFGEVSNSPALHVTDYEPVCLNLAMTAKKGVCDRLLFSKELEKNKENLEEMLYSLAVHAKEKMRSAQIARIILDAIKMLKRKANLKLTLDVMCLKLGEANG